MKRYSWGGIIYIIIGIFMASTHGYLSSLNSVSNILSALLAVLLWPLLLIGVSLHVTL